MANAGSGSASHLCGLMFQNALKTTMTTVPYKGTAPAMTDLIGGQVDLMCEQAVDAVPQIEGERVKATVDADERLEPANHRKFVETEMTRWAKVIKDAGKYAD